MVPVRYDLHEGGTDSIHGSPNKGLDLQLKQMAQTYFEEHNGNRAMFRELFREVLAIVTINRSCELHMANQYITNPLFS